MDDAGVSASAKDGLAEMQDDSNGEEDLGSDGDASEPTEAKEEGSPESNVRQRKVIILSLLFSLQIVLYFLYVTPLSSRT